MTDILLQAAVVGFVLLTLYAAVSDLLTMTIPNRISIALVLLFVAVAPVSHLDLTTFGLHMAVGAGALLLTFALFSFGLFGGGDAKLAAAIALWMGPAAGAAFAVQTALFGGVLALVFLVVRRLPMPALATRPAWSRRLLDRTGGIPYGIAIAAGALAVLPTTAWVGFAG